MKDRLIALKLVKARHASLPVLHRAGPRARQIQGGQDLQGFVIQLDQPLAAVAPDCALPVGVRAGNQTAEVARTKPRELPLLVGQLDGTVRNGPSYFCAVLLVAPAVGDRVFAGGQKRVAVADGHRSPE